MLKSIRWKENDTDGKMYLHKGKNNTAIGNYTGVLRSMRSLIKKKIYG